MARYLLIGLAALTAGLSSCNKHDTGNYTFHDLVAHCDTIIIDIGQAASHGDLKRYYVIKDEKLVSFAQVVMQTSVSHSESDTKLSQAQVMGGDISMYLLSSDGKTRLHIPIVNQDNEGEDKDNRNRSLLDGQTANHSKFIEYALENSHAISPEEFAGISGLVDESLENDVNMRYWRK
ncbi:MAG TPA: hypothetical protein PKB02_02665 [Anaerohalosphaeraceae bacterium]|nr:hypothetical protein [Anaerohalosphaeraceae bacterium]